MYESIKYIDTAIKMLKDHPLDKQQREELISKLEGAKHSAEEMKEKLEKVKEMVNNNKIYYQSAIYQIKNIVGNKYLLSIEKER